MLDIITIVPLVLLWILIWAALDFGYWFGLLLAVPAAGLLVRLFMIQHMTPDHQHCAHLCAGQQWRKNETGDAG